MIDKPNARSHELCIASHRSLHHSCEWLDERCFDGREHKLDERGRFACIDGIIVVLLIYNSNRPIAAHVGFFYKSASHNTVRCQQTIHGVRIKLIYAV